MPETYSCFFDFTEKSDSEGEQARAGKDEEWWGSSGIMDQEGQGIDVAEQPGILEALGQHFASKGWVRVPCLGVPPQCRSKVQLEAEMLQRPRRAKEKVGSSLAQGMTNMADGNGRARTDSVLFLDFHGGDTQLREELRGLFKLDQIIERVVGQLATQLQSSQLNLSLSGRTKMMLARYEPGGFYLPHIDADEGDDRVLTATYYLNRDWKAEDGGALRLLVPGGNVEVLPEEDTLVLFRADEVLHEVCRSRSRRLAVTIWFKGVCGQVQADVNGSLQRNVPLRRLPGSLQPAAQCNGLSPWQVRGEEMPGRLEAERRPVVPARRKGGDDSSCSSDEGGGSTPVLVCFNIVGFRLQQGIEKFAGLFVSARKLGIKDHVVLSYPEDYGIEGGGDRWWEYVDRLIEAIDKKPRRAGRPLLLWAHSLGVVPALSVAYRLGSRVLKIYMADGSAPERGGFDGWAAQTADFQSWSDARWMLQLAAWNPGSSVLQEMAAAVQQGWDPSKSKGAQDLLAHGKRQYLNAIHPVMGRDADVVVAPIFVFSMIRDEVVPLDHVMQLERWTTGGLHVERFDATHMGWLEPTADKATRSHRCYLFDRVCADIAENLDRWSQLG